MKKNILITGGAGFIGTNLVCNLISDKRIGTIRVLDNLCNGKIDNINQYFHIPNFEFIEGDIRDYETCLRATKGMDLVSHQAALGSVPRSIENPIQSAEVNIMGTLNILHASVLNKVDRVVLAFSSSTYGDDINLPKKEEIFGNPLSPYAVTKYSIEQFASVFGNIYSLKWFGLRYFNVFGPYQFANNPYAAVIPIFCQAALKGDDIFINGDGLTSRDFTFVSNVVHMNKLAFFTDNTNSFNQIYNCAIGGNINLSTLAQTIIQITGSNSKIYYNPERLGDVKHSHADISKAKNLLNYSIQDDFITGLKKTIEFYKRVFH